MRIGELLIADGLATSEQIATGLETQVIHGGRLGTNLVELYRLPLDVLGEALGRQHGMPAAVERHFQRCDPELQKRLSPDLAAQWHAVPLGRLPGDRPQVAVAVSDPLPAAGIDALSLALEAEVVLAIAPELRILYALETVYGVDRLNRFVRLPAADARATDDRRRYIQTLSDAEPQEPSALARVAVKKIAVTTTGEVTIPGEVISLGDGIRQMRRVNSRARLGHLLLETITRCMVPPLQGMVVFLLRKGIATGWNGAVADGNNDVIDSLAIEVKREPYIRESLESNTLSQGPPPLDPAHERLWAAMGIPAPLDIIVAPVVVRGRPVACLFGFTARQIDAALEEDMTSLSEALGKNFERLYRAAER